MTKVNIDGFTTILKEVKDKQSSVPKHSLDWNIYQGQLDLLTKVQGLFSEDLASSNVISPPVKEKTKVLKDKIPTEGSKDQGKSEQKDNTEQR